ncbi:MAG: hypothetical protein ACLFUJ_01950 [Phycisphaerae bacterium]
MRPQPHYRLLPSMAIVLAWLCAANAEAPAPPRLAYAQTRDLAAQARKGMDLYLRRRTGPEDQPVLDSLAELDSTRYPVAVTFWQEGKAVARAVHSRLSTPRNAIAAALDAMRSPLLGNRVTGEVLAGLTIEIEVLSPGRYVEDDQLPASIQPGLTSLTLIQGMQEAHVTAGEAYRHGLDVDQMRREAISRIRLRPQEADLKRLWKVHGTLQILDAPGQVPVVLFRGKRPIDQQNVDLKLARTSGLALANALLAHQSADGRLGDPKTDSLADHAWAIYALARQAGKNPTDAQQRAIDAGMAFSARALSADQARSPAEQLAETAAWTAMTSLAISPDGQGQQAREELVRALVEYASARSGAEDPLGSIRSDAVICHALGALPGSDQQTQARRQLLERLGKIPPQNAQQWGWLIFAGVKSPAAPTGVDPQAHPRTDAIDTRGGFAFAGQLPTTESTALALINIAAGRRWPESPGGPAWPADSPKAAQLAQARFLIQMTVRASEAWFAPEPGRLVGQVRIHPASARTSLAATAAALHAMATALGR